MSILYKFILSILSMLFVIVSFFTYQTIKEQKRILSLQLEKRVNLMKEHLIQDATNTIEYYKNEVENDLASMNLSRIQMLFNQLVERDNVDGITLSNNSQSMQIFAGLSHKKDVDAFSFDENQTSIIAASPIELTSKWGSLNIIYSLKELNDEIVSAQRDIEKFIDKQIMDALIFTLLLSIFFGVISYILAVKITKPILFLTNKADQIANGEIDECKELIDVETNDEVGKLAQSFMKMSQKLNRSYLELKQLNDTLEKKVEKRTEELRLLAVTDPMTQLYNRRYFTSVSNDVLSIAKREQQDLSLIMIDLDRFKSINDNYGHKVGDDVIIEFAKILKGSQRNSDILCRFGGEEFIILLPRTNIEGAIEVAQNLREKTQNLFIKLDNDETLKFTISLGVTSVDFEKESDIEVALHRADRALYEAKNSGRNKVCSV